MFEAIKKFTRRHKDERKRSLLENAWRIMAHDHHLFAQQGARPVPRSSNSQSPSR